MGNTEQLLHKPNVNADIKKSLRKSALHQVLNNMLTSGLEKNIVQSKLLAELFALGINVSAQNVYISIYGKTKKTMVGYI